jgi:hypothetical protein
MAMSWQRLAAPKEKKPKARLKAPRFLVDESLGVDAAHLLRERKWNAKFVAEAGLSGKSDETVFALAWKEKRVLLTHDRDFLDNRRFPPERNPGLVVFVIGASGENDAGLLRAFGFMQGLVEAFGRTAMRGTKIVFSDDEHISVERRNTAGQLVTDRFLVPANSSWRWIEE